MSATRPLQAVTLAVDIEGMTCQSCVATVADAIGDVPGVTAVDVDLTRAQARVETDGDVDETQLRAAIDAVVTAAGYRVARPDIVTRDGRVWAGAAIGAAVGAALWWAISSVPGANLASTGEVLFALFAGLLAGATTCAALIGSLALTVAADDRHVTAADRWATQARFHVGRVAAFTAAGAALGATGAILPPVITQTFTYVAVALVVVVALRASGLFPVLARLRVSVPVGNLRGGGRWGALGVGAASVLVPCGITQVVALSAAATGSALQGAIVFGVFAVGTIPGLVAFVAVPALLGRRKAVTSATAVVAVILALGSIGLVGGSATASARNTAATVDAAAHMDLAPAHLNADGVIEIDVHVDENGYTPSNVTVAAGYPVQVNFDAKTLLTCAAAPVLPDGQLVALDHGVTEIDLGVLEPRIHTISCSMNMYHLAIDAR